jgi:heat shock protein HtpX
MATLYTNIESNKRQTWIIMILFIAVVSLLGWFLGEYFLEGNGLFFIGFALIFSGISSFISYYNSDKIVLAISGAKEVKKEDSPDLHNLVENMSIASGIPKPRVYVINDSAMNAFATGRDPKNGVICFTTGILQRLEKRELEGVIAHEMAHIGNYDIRLMSIVSVLVGSIALLADFFTRGIFYGGGRRRSDSGGGGILFLLGIIFVILSPIIATLIKLALSRNREYYADSTAAMITRHPKGLADALLKISSDREVLEAANGATAHLYIANPLKGNHAGLMANLFSTHPPVEERVKRLMAL